MNRSKKLVLNTVLSLLHQVVSLVCGFILPRLFLQYYGSETNGLVSSIAYFLGFITFAECGIGAVVQSSLYKPLAVGDEDEISRIIVSADNFFKKIAYLLVGYTVVLMLVYPLITIKSYDYLFTLSLIFIISISSFVQYYFSMSYRLLLVADQKAYVQLGSRIIALVLNTVMSVIMLRIGFGVRIVKLMTSVVFLIQPVVMIWYVKRNYHIDRKIDMGGKEPIKQKWNGLAHHIAAVVHDNTDVVVLTLFSTLASISVYGVYNQVVMGIRQIVTSITTGMQSLLGNMYASKETDALNRTFESFEWIMHTVTVIFFTCACILVIPFVRVYTNGITDTNYIVPTFAVIICIANALYCLRIPYNMMVMAAGHYKETQASAIIEACINIGVSIILVIKFGLIGVAIGTMIAMIYRSSYLAYYSYRYLLNRAIWHYIKYILVDFCIGISAYFATDFLSLNSLNYFNWLLLAIQVFIIVSVVVIIINLLFFRRMVKCGIDILLKKIKR